MTQAYDAADIEVLAGLDPVRKRPGMFTDTARPNHLAAEVIDNSVDEALAGHASRIDVRLHDDGSLEVCDDGRGMPVDLHPEEGVPGVELILTRLHAGGKFNHKQYRFAGGLHGVGVSVVNALSSRLAVQVWRGGGEYLMEFAGGEIARPLTRCADAPVKRSGTSLRFWPDGEYFDSVRFSVPRLKHLLRAKAVLCPGLVVTFTPPGEEAAETWQYREGLREYLHGALGDV
ncbi:MAG: ATP-binding protein, partial [Salinisphaera sp.]|nr:ATP-binding protein [Salinisphaera sp.]